MQMSDQFSIKINKSFSEDEDEGELAKHSCARLLQPLPTLGSLFKAERRSLSLQIGRIYVKLSTECVNSRDDSSLAVAIALSYSVHTVHTAVS